MSEDGNPKKEEVQENSKTEAKIEETSKEETPATADEQNPEENGDSSAMPDDSIIKSDEGNVGDNEEEEEEEDDESEGEELPPGLLERPVEILKEKRERKKISRFNYDDAQGPASDKKKPAFSIPNGKGIKLGDHPRVEFQLQRNKAEDLRIIHKFFFGTFADGSVKKVKKNIRKFCGFDFEKDSPEYEKKEEYIGKFTVDNLKWAMEVCDVENRKGNKDTLIDVFMEWCLCPKPQDKPLPGKRKKDPANKRKAKPKQEGNVDILSTDDETQSKPAKRKKIQTKKEDKKKHSPTKRKSTGSGKKAKIKITSPKSKSSVVTSSSDADDSDDEPLQKKKASPTDNDIRKCIEKILKGADLEVVTMKSVFQQVYEKYPDFDLTDRKAYIKETVKKIIS